MDLRAILFDLDGTLTKYSLDYKLSREKVIVELNRLNLGKFSYTEKVSISILLRRVEDKMSNGKYKQLLTLVNGIIEEYEVEAASQTNLMPFALEALTAVKKNDLKTAIVTNNGKAASSAVINRLNFGHLIDTIVTREDAERWKPDGATIREALRRLSIKPANVIFIGDSIIDIQAAKDSNVISVALPTGPTNAKTLLRSEPDYAIPSLSEVPLLLEMLKPSYSKCRSYAVGSVSSAPHL